MKRISPHGLILMAILTGLIFLGGSQPARALSGGALSGGGGHMCLLTPEGGVKCWGSNYDGQLGDGTRTDRALPVNVIGLESGVVALSASWTHTCAVTAAGGVKCWGANWNAQLGDGTTTRRLTPVDTLPPGSGASAVSCGGYHSCALSTEGKLWCWGWNSDGQIGDGTTQTRSTPVEVTGLGGAAKAVSAGGSHTCARLANGAAKCWGANSSGQLGDGSDTGRGTPGAVAGLAGGVSGLTAGSSHTCALLASGGVQCWGGNWQGQLGDGTTGDRYQPGPVQGLAGPAVQISSENMHTCATLVNGGVQCWGFNNFGQVGDGTRLNRSLATPVSGLSNGVSAVAAGDHHTCALAREGVKCWGDNSVGQLGQGSPTLRSLPAETASLDNTALALAVGSYHACSLTANGGVQCWGRNYYSQLGDGTTDDRGWPAGVTGLSGGFQALTAGATHTCALNSAGGVQCWGDNRAGELGDGSQTRRSTPVAVSGLAGGVKAVTAGGYFTCALTDGGGVKCWGDNWAGNLGDGSGVGQTLPVNVAGLQSGVQAVSAGEAHACALLENGGVLCWGHNEDGELGDGTTMERTTPVAVSGLGGKAIAISAGGGYWGAHTCAVLENGTVQCWGSNGSGQLGTGSAGPSSPAPQTVSNLPGPASRVWAGAYHSCARLADGSAWCWGGNRYGQLGDGTLSDQPTATGVNGLSAAVLALDVGEDHTCALAGSGRVKCWGADYNGQLGVGSRPFSATPLRVRDAVPGLTLSYPTAQPGSWLTLNGWSFAPGTAVRLTLNGQEVDSGFPVNATGSFVLFLNTTGMEPGGYALGAEAPGMPAVAAGFRLAAETALREAEGGGVMLALPAGLGYPEIVYLPVVRR